MTAITKGFRSRAQLGMTLPRSVSRNITPANGGAAAHWEGGHLGITAATPHVECEARWRGIQRYHMVTRGWVDIAYTGGYCQHGYAFAGRGFYTRTAANGTNSGNQNYYAFCFLGGTGDVATTDALNALEWWVREARLKGGAGMKVVPHSSLFATACPGPQLKTKAAALNDKFIPAPATTPAPPTPAPVPPVPVPAPPTPPVVVPTGYTLKDCKAVQGALRVTADGKWGSGTDKAAVQIQQAFLGKAFNTVAVQRIIGVRTDGMFGPISRAALVKKAVQIQGILRVAKDGDWGPVSNKAFNTIRSQFLNKF